MLGYKPWCRGEIYAEMSLCQVCTDVRIVFPATEGYAYFLKHPCILEFNLEIYDPFYFMKAKSKDRKTINLQAVS